MKEWSSFQQGRILVSREHATHRISSSIIKGAKNTFQVIKGDHIHNSMITNHFILVGLSGIYVNNGIYSYPVSDTYRFCHCQCQTLQSSNPQNAAMQLVQNRKKSLKIKDCFTTACKIPPCPILKRMIKD